MPGYAMIRQPIPNVRAVASLPPAEYQQWVISRRSALIAAVIFVEFLSGTGPEWEPDQFLLRMGFTVLLLIQTAGPNNIENLRGRQPDGHVHIELRRQEFMEAGQRSTLRWGA